MIFYLHIPKTAGTTICKSVIEPNREVLHPLQFRGMRNTLREYSPKCRLIHGHFDYGLHRRFYLLGRWEAHRYMTVMREPVDRAVSHYYFIKNAPHEAFMHPHRELADSHTIVEFFKLPQFRNLMTKQIAGGRLASRAYIEDGAILGQKLLDQAKANLEKKFAVICFQDNVKDSAHQLAKYLNLPQPEIPSTRYKRSKRRPQMNEMSAELIEQLTDLHELDSELLAFAKSLSN